MASRWLAEVVERMDVEDGLYEPSSEYGRDQIRRDMQRRGGTIVQEAVLSGYRHLAAGRVA